MREPSGTKTAYQSHSIYTPLTLKVYDTVVHGVSNRLAWKYRTASLHLLYSRFMSNNHLDAGVGTGFFLRKSKLLSQSKRSNLVSSNNLAARSLTQNNQSRNESSPRICLLDLNPNSLVRASASIERFSAETICADVLSSQFAADIGVDPDDKTNASALLKFNSVGLNYLLHCLPGSMSEKSIAFDNLASLLQPHGILFGSTILGKGVRQNFIAKRLMAFYNRKGIFSNLDDSPDSLRNELEKRFEELEIKIEGVVAIFSARLR